MVGQSARDNSCVPSCEPILSCEHRWRCTRANLHRWPDGQAAEKWRTARDESPVLVAATAVTCLAGARERMQSSMVRIYISRLCELVTIQFDTHLHRAATVAPLLLACRLIQFIVTRGMVRALSRTNCRTEQSHRALARPSAPAWDPSTWQARGARARCRNSLLHLLAPNKLLVPNK